MKQPKKLKYNKKQKGKGIITAKSKATCNYTLTKGNYGIKVLQSGYITSAQIEAMRIALVRKLGRTNQIWLNIFPDIPVTTKALGARMGGGKGEISYWCSRVKAGTIIYEILIYNKPDKFIVENLQIAGRKLPMRTEIIKNSFFLPTYGL